jgi:(p)ppGpp synthase/HD superfamily hydrolase
MHRVAEYGMASHWLYKEQQQLSQGSGAMPKPYRIPWLTCITDWQHEIKSSREFVEAIRRELLGQRVFVFLRDGKILNLSRGAAVIDAAFQIHTEVGLSMTGATINGQPAPFDYELRNGDVVSIQTSSIDEASPKPEWLRYATSRSTRAKLRQYFKTVQRDTLIDVGHTILDDFLRQQREVIVQHLGAVPEKATLMRHVRTRSPEDSMEDFCMHLAHSDDRDVANLMSKVLNIPAEAFVDLPAMNDVQWAASSSTHSGTSPTPQAPVDAFIPAGNEPAGTSSTRSKWGPGVGFMDDVDQGPHTEEKGISIPAMLPPPPHIGGGGAPAASSQLLGSATDRTGGDDVEPIVYAEPEMLCQFCMPVRGDEVSGTVELNGEMTAHRRGCPEAELQLLAQRRGSRTRGGRLSGAQQQVQAPLARVPLRWPPTDRKGVLYTVDITVYCRDRKLLLSDVSNVVSKGSIIASTASKTHGRDATLSFSIMVRDLEQLQLLLDSLSQVESVMTCERAFGR